MVMWAIGLLIAIWPCALVDSHGPCFTAHEFSYFPEVWKQGMKTNRKNGYENFLVKLPERQLWPKRPPWVWKMYEKGMKTPYLKVPWRSCDIIVPGLPPKGMKTKVSFHTPPQGMKTHQSFHTLQKMQMRFEWKNKRAHGHIYIYIYIYTESTD